jgi:hypothetical protein
MFPTISKNSKEINNMIKGIGKILIWYNTCIYWLLSQLDISLECGSHLMKFTSLKKLLN